MKGMNEMENKQTQTNKVLNHMIEHGKIDFMTALDEYRITRLSARIADLKNMGIPVVSVCKQYWNGSEFVFNYKEYSIEGSYLRDIRGH